VGPVLALLAAVAFGVEDVVAAVAARRTSALTVALGTTLVGFVLLLPVLAFTPGTASIAALGWGAVAGGAGSLAFVVYLRAMARGQIGVVSPLAALTGSAIPVGWGVVVLGDELSLRQVAGVLAGLVAVALVAWRPGTRFDRLHLEAPLSALAAGAGFGVFYIALDATPDGSGLWPLVGARIAAAVVIVALLRIVSRPAPPRDAIPYILTAGVTGMVANALFLVATRYGLLSLTSVLTSLYPVVALVLARQFLQERLRRLQTTGVAVALTAVSLLVVP
jgi:drug/metabolite transporter (DMT)-like permease